VVFRLDPSGTETVLHSFNCQDEGGTPTAGVISDPNGLLFGTTYGGGSGGHGVVYRLDKNGQETVLHSFTGGSDGATVYAGLVRDSAGNLYGVTRDGGADDRGVVYKVTKDGVESILHSFTGGSDGGSPYGTLILDAAGNLYGTTGGGGKLGGRICENDPGLGCGVVFELSPGGTGTVLETFGGGDGANPWAGVIQNSKGNLFGTTTAGGDLGGDCRYFDGCGVVFEIESSGTGKTIHKFTNRDGATPYGSLTLDTSGNLYGTVQYFNGAVFKIDPSGTETELYVFTGGTDGSGPISNAILDSAGNIYGTAPYSGLGAGCGDLGCGVVFKIAP
jgi:uncharacterized repeat protein (TIGR03803 family)